jgi:hypothetical protein
VPNSATPLGEATHATHYGNGQLWTALYYPTLTVTERNRGEDGSITEKFGWWRAVAGALTIEGARVDDPSLHVEARIPSGYGSSGFQVAAITFPTEGCWRIVGRVGPVADVRRRSRRITDPKHSGGIEGRADVGLGQSPGMMLL